MSQPFYADLHVSSNFSFLQGASHPEELVAEAKALGHGAMAITDRNSLAGIVRGHVTAKEQGLRFVVGARLDLLNDAKLGADSRPGASFLAYPSDRAAYGRLCQLITTGRRRAPKGACWIDRFDLRRYAQGLLLVLLPPPSDLGPEYEAQVFDAYAAFAGQLYLAMQHHLSGDDQSRMAEIARLAEKYDLPLLATNDVLYHTPHRKPLQDILTCIRHGCKLDEAGTRLYPNAERRLKSPAEMAVLFKDYPQALANIPKLIARCDFSLDQLRYEYPKELTKAGETPQQTLTRLTWEGAERRFPARMPDKHKATITRELALIERMNYAPYFLTVHDIVRFARNRGILCQGRGSAANSLVCYCLESAA